MPNELTPIAKVLIAYLAGIPKPVTFIEIRAALPDAHGATIASNLGALVGQDVVRREEEIGGDGRYWLAGREFCQEQGAEPSKLPKSPLDRITKIAADRLIQLAADSDVLHGCVNGDTAQPPAGEPRLDAKKPDERVVNYEFKSSEPARREPDFSIVILEDGLQIKFGGARRAAWNPTPKGGAE